MDPTFGARLRQQREERQVTLTTISAKTKIKMALLEALEHDDFSFWPKGLFGRAYLRDYATAIGIDPESVVSEFLGLHPEFAYVTPEVEEMVAAQRAEESRRGAAQKFRRFVSSAFSVRPRVPTSTRLDGRDDNGGLSTDDVEADAYGEVVSASIPHLMAEANERIATPFAELDAREAVAEPEPIDAEPAQPELFAPPAIQTALPVADISLTAAADVCTRLARAMDWREVTTLLADAARLLDAVGVIVWQWDPRATALRPSLAYGYADAIVARLPDMRSDDANAVATAFRSGEQCIVDGDMGTEAVVVPSLGVGGCVGVLAVELHPGTRTRESICAFANILAAQLAMLLPSPEPVEA